MNPEGSTHAVEQDEDTMISSGSTEVLDVFF
jgi:hypothetical protein